MSAGLLALLDDVAALTKAAAASLDDIAAQATKAGTKAAGVVIDDAAVTPRYVTDFSPARELPIIWKIAVGSLRNKMVFILPAALLLSFFLPQAITPLLMLGGVYLCYEGVEKLVEALFPHTAHADGDSPNAEPKDAQAFEDEKVAGAIRTDFILSAEIMTIALGSVAEANFVAQATVLALVGIVITVAVYGVVALIVKADDLGVLMARVASSSLLGKASRTLGRGLVTGMPYFLVLLSAVGTAAMIWVGGGIMLHGFETYGLGWPAHAIEGMASAAARALPAIGSAVDWLVTALGSGIAGIVVGLIAIPVVSHVLTPLLRRFT